MVACRSRGAAPTRCQATASAIAALGPLADVAVDGGRQTLPSHTPNLCLSRLIQESAGFWYRFQLLRLAAQTAHQVHECHNERNPQDSKHHERFGMLKIVSPIREEMVIADKEVQTRAEE